MTNVKEQKTITVLNPAYRYMSKCSHRKMSMLLESGRAVKINDDVIRLKETKQTRKDKKHKIIEDSGRRCYICNNIIPDTTRATIDHVIPKSKDHSADTYENMKCCCCRCNKDKGNMTPDDYINYIIAHRQQYDYLSDDRIAYLKKAFVSHQEYFNSIKKSIIESG